MELWALKKRLNDFINLSDEMMTTHPAIKITNEKIEDIEKVLKELFKERRV